MAKTINVSLVTPDTGVLRREVDALVVPTKLGEVTILPEHVALLAELDAGVLSFSYDGIKDQVAVSGGFLEVHEDEVVVLADGAKRPEEVDSAASELAIADARATLKNLDGYDPAYTDALARIKQNEAYLRIARS